jgi:hypothetical protein
MQLDWKVMEEIQAQIKYLRPGFAKIPLDVFRNELDTFLEAVNQQLRSKGITDTDFQELWLEIKATDKEEEDFCVAAAALGKDPYEVNDADAEEIVEAANLLPNGLYIEFFNAVGDGFTIGKAKRIQQILHRLSKSKSYSVPKPINPDRFTNLISHSARPWEDGYGAAKKLRKKLKLTKHQPICYSELLGHFGMEMNNPLSTDYFDLNGSSERIDVLITSNANNLPSLSYSKRFKKAQPEFRESNEKFAFCRAIFEYLYHQDRPALVTSSHLSSQKRNRAFAAEFLAPAETIEKMIQGKSSIFEEEVQAIANKLKVAEFLVKHQIENNKLARIKPQFQN